MKAKVRSQGGLAADPGMATAPGAGWSFFFMLARVMGHS